MDCPRCNRSLITYTLDDRATFVCEACGYVGVPADHRADRTPNETWAEALARFRDRHDHQPPPDGGTVAVTVGRKSYRVPPDLRDRYRNLTAKQRAIIRELLAEATPSNPTRTRSEIAADAGVHPSYVSDVVKEYGDIAVALAASDRP